MVPDARWKDCIQKPRSLLQRIRVIRAILEGSSVAKRRARVRETETIGLEENLSFVVKIVF